MSSMYQLFLDKSAQKDMNKGTQIVLLIFNQLEADELLVPIEEEGVNNPPWGVANAQRRNEIMENMRDSINLAVDHEIAESQIKLYLTITILESLILGASWKKKMEKERMDYLKELLLQVKL